MTPATALYLSLAATATAAEPDPAPVAVNDGAPAPAPAPTGEVPTGEVPPATSPPAPSGPDRSQPPPVAPPELLSYAEPEIHELGPGVTAWYVRAPGVRKVAVDVVFQRGLVEIDGVPTMPGRASGMLASVAAGGLSSAELSERCDLDEITLRSRIGHHGGSVYVEVPRENLAHALELQRLVLDEPTFPRRDLRRWATDQHLYYEVTGPKSPERVASALASWAWFPADHPYGRRVDLGELDKIKGKDLRRRWASWTHGAPITVIVAGDVAWADLEPGLRALASDLGAAAPVGAELELPASGARVLAADMPGQEQVTVRLRLPAPAEDADDAAAFVALDDILGGQFLSRLNRNLREEKGFTYGVRSRYASGKHWGYLEVGLDVKATDLATTVTEIERELARLTEAPVTESELDATRRTIAASWNRTFESADRVEGTYAGALELGLPLAGLRARVAATTEVDAEDVQRVAQTWLAADRPRIWAFVGDRKAIESALAAVGLVPEWVDPAAAIPGKF